jgi:predicted nucleic acid-binding protein
MNLIFIKYFFGKAFKTFLKKGFLASGVVVLGIDEGICEIIVKERGKLRMRGKIIGNFDLLIASV